MAEAQAAPHQHKQPSRKGKKAWRKNVDVTEIQSGLEEIRDEIIQGGILSERPAEDLFVLDTAGAEAVKTDYAKKHKPLKSEQIIAQRSAVPAVDSRKRKSPEGVATGSSKRSKNGTYVSHKDLQRLKHLAAGGSTAAKDITLSESAAYDPWSVAPAPVSAEPELNFLEKKKAKRQPETLSHPPISLAASGKPFPAVKKPQGGKSYNPDFQDWDALVAREGQKEVEAELKRQQAEQAETERMEKALAEAARPEPKSDDEYESAWESEWDGIQSEAEDSQVTKKRPERKTPTERKKAIKRKEQEAKAKLEKQTKQREEQQNRVRQITKAVEKKERERKLRLALAAESDASEDENQDEVLRRRKFGKNPIPEAPLELVLPDELQDSLRALRPEGNLLKDRFRNLLLNGKIEARRPITQPKKPRREVTEKWSYKDWKLR